MGSFFVRYGGRTQTRTGWLVAQCGARQGHRREERAATVRGALRQDDPTGPVASLWAAKNGGRQPGCGRAAAAGPRRPIKRSLKARSPRRPPCPARGHDVERPELIAREREHAALRIGVRGYRQAEAQPDRAHQCQQGKPCTCAVPSDSHVCLLVVGMSVCERRSLPPEEARAGRFPPIPRASATADTRVRGFPRRDDGPASAIVAA